MFSSYVFITLINMNENIQEIQQDEKVERSMMKLGPRMKLMEKTERVPPYKRFLVRSDGNCFSKYTSGFEKPFDKRFASAMMKTASCVLEHFNARTVFCCSDEITLVFDQVVDRINYDMMLSSGEKNIPEHIYNGRWDKITSLIASKCSVLFNKFMKEEMEDYLSTRSDDDWLPCSNVIDRINLCEAIFDSRIIPIENDMEHEIVNNLIWRSSYDCKRNCCSTYARHILGKNETSGLNSTEMINKMLEKGVDWEKVPLYYKYGSYAKRILSDYVNDKGEIYKRSHVLILSVDILNIPIHKALQILLDKYWDNSQTELGFEIVVF
jgi:tRNA(His) guanylyltransferase